MENVKNENTQHAHAHRICEFVVKSSGLSVHSEKNEQLQIHQSTDGKIIVFPVSEVEEVIVREDSEGQGFLQVNFLCGKKILLTEKLVGFKPAVGFGLDMDKLPKVVTTPDLISVVEAIEESISDGESHPVEVDILKRVFDAVLEGGEAVGFNLREERAWLNRLTNVSLKPSA